MDIGQAIVCKCHRKIIARDLCTDEGIKVGVEKYDRQDSSENILGGSKREEHSSYIRQLLILEAVLEQCPLWEKGGVVFCLHGYGQFL